MKLSTVLTWLGANWFGALGTAIGIWVSFALRPRPRLRYWAVADGFAGVYAGGATGTRLYLRNVGNEAADADDWRAPLTVEFPQGIVAVEPDGVSHPDIVVSAELVPVPEPEPGPEPDGDAGGVPGERPLPTRAVLRISHLDPGDQVAFRIEHPKASRAPQLSGELRGSREPLARGYTPSQRWYGVLLVSLFLVPFDYIELATVAWLLESTWSVGGVLKGLLFLLAGPLPIALAMIPFYGTGTQMRVPHAGPAGLLACGVAGLMFPMRILAPLVAWLSGYQLWYPEFLVYGIGMLLVLSLIGVRILVTGVTGSPQSWAPPTVVSLAVAVPVVVFAVAVVAGASVNTLLAIGFAGALANTVTRVRPERLRHRLRGAFGGPTSRRLIRPGS